MSCVEQSSFCGLGTCMEKCSRGEISLSLCCVDQAILEYECMSEGREKLLAWFKSSSSLTSDSHPKGDIK